MNEVTGNTLDELTISGGFYKFGTTVQQPHGHLHDEPTVAGPNTAVQQSSNATTAEQLSYPTSQHTAAQQLAVHQLSHHLGSTVAVSNQQPNLTSTVTFGSTKGTKYSPLSFKKTS